MGGGGRRDERGGEVCERERDGGKEEGEGERERERERVSD